LLSPVLGETLEGVVDASVVSILPIVLAPTRTESFDSRCFLEVVSELEESFVQAGALGLEGILLADLDGVKPRKDVTSLKISKHRGPKIWGPMMSSTEAPAGSMRYS